MTCTRVKYMCCWGENGAGKSTLIKILSGVHTADEGEILLDGRPVHIRTPHDAKALGISTIFQEFTLVPDMSVGGKIIFLGRFPQFCPGRPASWIGSACGMSLPRSCAP